MSPPDAEWLLWARRLQVEHKSLLARIEANEQSSEAITLTAEQTKNLATNSAHLQEENNALNDRVLRLEQDVTAQDRTFGEANAQLKAEIAAQSQEIRDLTAILGTWEADAKAEREKRDQQIKDLKAQAESPPAGALPRHIHRTSRAPSQATTADDNMLIDQDTTSANAPTLQQPTIDLAPQGAMNLEQYLQYGRHAVPESIQQHEAQTVKAFVGNMRAKYWRATLWQRMEEKGWTWQKTHEELHRMVADGKRRKMNRRSLQAPL